MVVYYVDFTRKTFKKTEEVAPYRRPLSLNPPPVTAAQRDSRLRQARVRLVCDEHHGN